MMFLQEWSPMQKFRPRLMSIQCFMRTSEGLSFQMRWLSKTFSKKNPSKLISAYTLPNLSMLILFLAADIYLHMSF
jgi:hypothetical protein